MPDRDEEEQDLRIKVMQQDLKLKERQTFWENPRNFVVIIGGVIAATAAVVGVVAGLAGYKLGSQPTQPTQIIFQPGAIQVLPAPPAH
jgi:cytochrome c-type biogenesis protein CcmH/NrfG